MLFVDLTIPSYVAGHVLCSNDRLVASLEVVLNLVHNMALDVFAHVLMLLTDGTRRGAPATSLFFNFIDPLIMMMMSLPSATLVAILYMGA